jgi:ABC-2 type transport system permease protein
MKRMLMLFRRELWEHRALWAFPLAVAVLMLLGAVFGRTALPGGRLPLPPEATQAIFAFGVLAFSSVQYVTMSLVLWFYATDCLYSERKDRSILFWKSMPVSDAETVLSKALIATVVVPLGVFVLTAVTSAVAFGIWSVRLWSGSLPPLLWNTGAWLRVEGFSLGSLVAATLWYAPLTSYLMLVSAWARRNVQLWVLLPPIVAILLEWIAFGTHHLSSLLMYRLGSSWQSSILIAIERQFAGPALAIGSAGPAPLVPWRPVGQAFGNIDLWIGLAAAAALLFAATRIRRYRDDT